MVFRENIKVWRNPDEEQKIEIEGRKVGSKKVVDIEPSIKKRLSDKGGKGRKWVEEEWANMFPAA